MLIQGQVRGEQAYRGERFRDHPRDVAGDPDLLNLTRPDVVSRIHDEYFAAGADIATTNTFTATTIGQSDYALEAAVHEMNVEGARLARRAADEWTARTPDKPRFVAGAVGPLNVTLSLSPRVDEPSYRAVTFDAVRDAYAHQMRALREGGVDFFLIETVFDSLNAKAAIVAANRRRNRTFRSGSRSPPSTRAAATCRGRRSKRSGTRSSTPIRSSSASTARSARPTCGRSSRISRSTRRRGSPAIRTRASRTSSARYDEQPHDTSGVLGQFARDGLVNIVGGCCGTTPDHVRAIVAAVEGVPPRSVPEAVPATVFSGLEPFAITPDTNFVMIGERTNVTGSARFRRLIESDDYNAALEVALEQVRGGANLLDVNMDADLLDGAVGDDAGS